VTERLGRTASDIERAARALRAGRLVAFPTETVYGLGGLATSDQAVAAIFAAKGRPRFNPLIVHVQDRAAAAELVAWNEVAERLAARFWPGPLTLVLPRAEGCPLSPLVSAGGPTVGLRAPAHPVAIALLEATALPIAAPSANPAGAVSPTTADHVALGLGDRVDLILDGGRCRVGIESTVLDLTEARPRLLRPGGVTRAALEAEIGPLGTGPGDPARAPRGPGQLASHYAPTRPLRLNVSTVAADEALLAFGPEPFPQALRGAAATLNLSRAGDLEEAAANLFSMLHRLDRREVRAIAVMPIPGIGLGEAIRDRLARAAAPRPPRPTDVDPTEGR
jgi:L-threonylcarbamoyladenylate synthase